MNAQEHSTVREGVVVGLLGAAALAAWYLGSDAMQGQILHTPNVLGRIVFEGDTAAQSAAVGAGPVAAYLVLHVFGFILAGMALVWAIHAAIRHPTWRTGLFIAMVVALGYVYSILFSAPSFAGDPSLRWSVVAGALMAGIVMLGYLWRRHPSLKHRLREAEAPGPPHPPDGASANQVR